MPLRIVRSTEPLQIETIILTVYAAPGLWKTSICQTAKAPLTFDFDKGIHRAGNRAASVPVTTWADVQSLGAEDIAEFSTIVIDTVGRALDVLAQDIIHGNPKAGRPDGSLTLQGFGTLKSRFSQWIASLQALGKDIVLIAHMDEQKSGDETMERIDAQGSSKNEVYKKSDAMCRIRLDSSDKRYLDFDPRQGGFGKNPAQLPKIPVPFLLDPNGNRLNSDFLANVIAQIKGSINKLSEAQAEAVKVMEQWAAAVNDASTEKQFNALMKTSQDQSYSPTMKKLLVDAATAKGFVFDKTAKAFAPALAEAVAS